MKEGKDSIERFLEENPSFTTKDFIGILREGPSSYGERGAYKMLRSLQADGRISKAGRGIYTSSPRAARTLYHYEPSKMMCKIASKMKKLLPDGGWQTWERYQLNEFTHYAPSRNIYFIETEHRFEDEAFYGLQESFPWVLQEPDTDALKRFENRELIVVQRLLSDAPPPSGSTCQAGLEKILVDLLSRKLTGQLIDRSLYRQIFEEAFDRYIINEKALLRYARRRNLETEVRAFIENRTYVRLTRAKSDFAARDDYYEGEERKSMEGQLKTGTMLIAESGAAYQIRRLLGAGGQGEVYDVEREGKHYALKWYYPGTATPEQKKNLEKLVLRGAPSSSFLWPKDMVKSPSGPCFGYVMNLRPGNFRSIVDLMRRKAEPDFATLCRIAYNLTKGYRVLHEKGYCYRDISFGNLFFDPDSGRILICDNDNVDFNGSENYAVSGTPRFMAPEIVNGTAEPSRNTDLWSLGVLLFYIFMLNHPLEGRAESRIRCMDIHAMKQLYGTHPVFIFDPQDKSNRPEKGFHDNAIVFWDLYPSELKELFTQAFTTGIHSPNRRVTENRWLETFANMISSIVPCPKCGAEIFYDHALMEAGCGPRCWSCGAAASHLPSLAAGRRRVVLIPDRKLYAHHINDDFDMETVVGRVVRSPRNPGIWGIQNESAENWTYIRGDGANLPIAPGQRGTVKEGARINFGRCEGVIE